MVKDWKAKLGQIPPPMEKVTRTYQPSLIMSHGKVVRYDLRSMGVWRAVVSTTYTILTEWDTWYLLIALTVLCFMAFAVVVGAGWDTAIEDNGSVTSRVQLLLSFVLGGYVSLVINRWDKLRNTTFGILWGSLENLVVYSYMSFRGNGPLEDKWRKDVLRYARLCMLSLFHATRAEDNIPDLEQRGLITKKEAEIYNATMVGTRPLMSVIWIYKVFEKAKAKGYDFPIEGRMLILNNVTAARGGVGATLGILGCPYPYGYIHIVYWIVQIYLFILAVETGVMLAIFTKRINNGDGGYTNPAYQWPSDGWVWYSNVFVQTTVQNVVFALFAQGLLRVCDKMQSPFSNEESSFPEYAYDAFIHNNCMAMLNGLEDLSDDEGEDDGTNPENNRTNKNEEAIKGDNPHASTANGCSGVSGGVNKDGQEPNAGAEDQGIQLTNGKPVEWQSNPLLGSTN